MGGSGPSYIVGPESDGQWGNGTMAFAPKEFYPLTGPFTWQFIWVQPHGCAYIFIDIAVGLWTKVAMA